MTFTELLTPTDVPAQWTRAVDADRVPQAVLLAGPAGSELLPLTLRLLQYLQCTDRRRGNNGFGESCQACEACRGSEGLVHPDVHFTFPVVGTGATSADQLPQWRAAVTANPYLSQGDWLRAQTTDNKQGNINREEVMRILHDVSLQRFTEGYKAVVVWGADFLGEESNRLLKVIEEPPARTCIFLVTHRPDRILPTIVSRCRVYRVPPPPAAAIARMLATRGAEAERAADLAHAAGGDLALALSSLDGGDGEDSGKTPTVAAWLRACFAGRGAGIVKAGHALAAQTREQQKHYLLRALRFVRELGVARAGTPRPLRLGPSDREVADKLSRLLDWRQLTALADELNGLVAAVERNANGKIAFVAASIRLHHILAQRSGDAPPSPRVPATAAAAQTPTGRAS